MRTRAMFVSEVNGEHLRVLGSAVTVKATSDDTGGAVEWVIIESRHGADVELHRHPWGESYYILDGTLEVQVGGRKHQATAGAFVMIPPRALHGFHVVSDTARLASPRGTIHIFESASDCTVTSRLESAVRLTLE